MKINQKNTTRKRLRILGDDEIEAIYGQPHFTQEERDQYFTLSQKEKNILAEFRSTRYRSVFMQIYCARDNINADREIQKAELSPLVF